MAQDVTRVVAHIVAKPSKLDEARSMLEALVEPTRNEAGCLRYELMKNLSDETEFVFIEEWADEAALTAHFSTPHVRAAFAQAADLLAAPPDIRKYRLIK